MKRGCRECQTHLSGFALDCCDREALSWATTTAGHSGDIVRDVMLAAVESRFGGTLKPPHPIEWLTDNGSGYIAEISPSTRERFELIRHGILFWLSITPQVLRASVDSLR